VRRRPGLIAVVALVVVAVSVLAVRAFPRASGYEVTAVFEQAHGLVPGGRVWSGGAVVGQVSGIRLGPDGLPRVRMRIDDDYVLHRGATADLRLLSNSGELNRVVMLTSGKGPSLRHGAVIPSTQTDQPVELDDALAAFTPRMRRDFRGVIAQLDGATSGLDGAFRSGLRESAGAFAETAALLRAVDRDGAALRTVVTQGRDVSGALAANREQLGASIDGLRSLLSRVSANGQRLRTALPAIPPAVTSARSALDELRRGAPVLHRLLDASRPATEQLVPTSRLLRTTLDAAQPTLVDLATTVHSAPRDMQALTPLLRAATPTLKTLDPLLHDVLPVLDLTRVYTPEVAGFLSNWTDIASTYDAAGHGVRMMNSGPRPPDKVVSPDRVDPGYIDSPYLRTPGALTDEPWTDYRQSFLSQDGGKP
jgi:phospholipid/cholesterol/gamma-HCH transport system substrate-binding protein